MQDARIIGYLREVERFRSFEESESKISDSGAGLLEIARDKAIYIRRFEYLSKDLVFLLYLRHV